MQPLPEQKKVNNKWAQIFGGIVIPIITMWVMVFLLMPLAFPLALGGNLNAIYVILGTFTLLEIVVFWRVYVKTKLKYRYFARTMISVFIILLLLQIAQNIIFFDSF